MKQNILIGLILLGVSSCSSSQEALSFKRLILVGHSFSAEKDIAPKDSFMTKRYILVNASSDTLCLIQKVPFEIRNGNVKIYEIGLTERFVSLQDGYCYDITLKKDVNQLLTNPDYIKHRKIDFWFKDNNGGIKKGDYFANLILESIIVCDSK